MAHGSGPGDVGAGAAGESAPPLGYAGYVAAWLTKFGRRERAAGAARVQREAPAPGVAPRCPAPELERPPWHARHAVRRARAVAAALLVVGGVAAVPYPRYVTEEC